MYLDKVTKLENSSASTIWRSSHLDDVLPVGGPGLRDRVIAGVIASADLVFASSYTQPFSRACLRMTISPVCAGMSNPVSKFHSHRQCTLWQQTNVYPFLPTRFWPELFCRHREF